MRVGFGAGRTPVHRSAEHFAADRRQATERMAFTRARLLLLTGEPRPHPFAVWILGRPVPWRRAGAGAGVSATDRPVSTARILGRATGHCQAPRHLLALENRTEAAAGELRPPPGAIQVHIVSSSHRATPFERLPGRLAVPCLMTRHLIGRSGSPWTRSSPSARMRTSSGRRFGCGEGR